MRGGNKKLRMSASLTTPREITLRVTNIAERRIQRRRRIRTRMRMTIRIRREKGVGVGKGETTHQPKRHHRPRHRHGRPREATRSEEERREKALGGSALCSVMSLSTSEKVLLNFAVQRGRRY